MRRSKKAGEQVIVVYWIIIFILVAGALVFGISKLVDSPLDVRQVEEEYLASHIADCLTLENSQMQLDRDLVNNFDESNPEKFLESCNLVFETSLNLGESQYYVKLRFLDYASMDLTSSLANSVIELGDDNLALLEEVVDEKEVYKFYFYSGSEEYILEIKPIVGKVNENT